jgi:multidrug efflux pump subunit AcrA (membrane-fusion protein)
MQIKDKTIIITVFLIIFALTALYGQQSGQGRGERPSGEGDGTSGERRQLPVAAAEMSEQYRTIAAGGRLRPKNRVEHLAAASGYIQSVFVREGSRVSRGDELLRIERDDVTGSYKPASVTARISGIVSEVSVGERDEIRDGETAVTVIGTEEYVLEASISDKDAFKVSVGEEITGRTVDGNTITGFLTGRSPEPDYDTGLFFLVFEFPNTQATHVGEFVLVDLPVDRESGIFVNRDVLVRRYGSFFLWVVNDENKLEAREVRVGPSFGDMVKIEEGLAVGERYLTRLTGREREGMSIDA